jgi:hypothetical protein
VKEAQERPLAAPEYEQSAHELFPLDMSPEEYAARHGHGWLCFSFSSYRFRNERLDAWIQRLGEIFSTPGLLEKCRQEILTPEDMEEVRREMKRMAEEL